MLHKCTCTEKHRSRIRYQYKCNAFHSVELQWHDTTFAHNNGIRSPGLSVEIVIILYNSHLSKCLSPHPTRWTAERHTHKKNPSFFLLSPIWQNNAIALIIGIWCKWLEDSFYLAHSLWSASPAGASVDSVSFSFYLACGWCNTFDYANPFSVISRGLREPLSLSLSLSSAFSLLCVHVRLSAYTTSGADRGMAKIWIFRHSLMIDICVCIRSVYVSIYARRSKKRSTHWMHQ